MTEDSKNNPPPAASEPSPAENQEKPVVLLRYSQRLPPETQDVLQVLWDSLSPIERNSLLKLINSIPGSSTLMRTLVKMATAQYKLAFGKQRHVAIVGPANVGKSTLYNQFITDAKDRAAVSALPGTTRVNQEADAGLFSVIDTPGADAVGDVGLREQEEALNAASQADFLIIMFDAIQGIKQTELELYHRLQDLRKPYVVVLNKIDLAKRESKAVTEHAAQALGLQAEQVLPIAARTGDNLAQVLSAIAIADPEIVAALGQALPQYRWQLTWRAIVSAASLSAVIALAPLPIIDFVPLIATQSMMVLGIARIYNYQITPARARELVATFGLGFLGRTLFQELSKLGGIPGWLLSAAIASSTTVVMGYAASVWFDKGEKVSGESLNKLTRQVTEYLLEVLKNFGKRKPSQKSLRERIQMALEQLPLAKEPPK